MANEQLTIQPNDARMTVIGKSWPDQASDSGGGDWDDTYNGTYSGPIPRTDLPTKIAVTTPPTKQEYGRLDRIEFDGMVVTAYNEDGSVWTSADYPNGTIPLNEIISTRRTARGVDQPKDNTVQFGRFTDPKYGTDYKFFLTKHLHIEGVPDAGRSYEIIDRIANDGFFIFADTRPPYYSSGYLMRSIRFGVVAEKVSSVDQLCDENINSMNGFNDYKTGHWDGSNSHDIFEYYTISSASYAENSDGIRYYTRLSRDKHFSIPFLASYSFNEGQYTCNVPLQYVENEGRISISGTGYYDAYSGFPFTYLYTTSFQNVSDVTLYWQRPGDGLYLSCTLPIFIKSDDSD